MFVRQPPTGPSLVFTLIGQDKGCFPKDPNYYNLFLTAGKKKVVEGTVPFFFLSVQREFREGRVWKATSPALFLYRLVE